MPEGRAHYYFYASMWHSYQNTRQEHRGALWDARTSCYLIYRHGWMSPGTKDAYSKDFRRIIKLRNVKYLVVDGQTQDITFKFTLVNCSAMYSLCYYCRLQFPSSLSIFTMSIYHLQASGTRLWNWSLIQQFRNQGQPASAKIPVCKPTGQKRMIKDEWDICLKG